MEKAGVLGTDFSFDPNEVKAAQAASTTINIGNIGSFAGNLGVGNTAGKVAVSDVDVSLTRNLVDQVRDQIDEFRKAGLDADALNARLNEIEKSLSQGSDPGTLRNLLTDLRGTLTGAAGNLAATGALTLINSILGTGIPPT